jgi:outer membrane lipoprotein-sorting protein
MITACVGRTPSIKESSTGKQAVLSDNQAIVFGKFKWSVRGDELEIGRGPFDFYFYPSLLRMEDRTETNAEVDGNGNFVWALEPGVYVINKITYRDPWTGNYFMAPQVAFQIPDKGKVYYIGTLKIDFESKRDFLKGLSGKVTVTIEDQGIEAYTIATETLDMLPENIEKSLMVREKELPKTIDTTEDFNTAISILSGIFSWF